MLALPSARYSFVGDDREFHRTTNTEWLKYRTRRYRENSSGRETLPRLGHT